MLATLAGRVVGLAREIFVAAIFGAGATMSAFAVAFQIPNLIRSFVADVALTSSVVPVFTDLLEKGEDQRAWKVAGTIATLVVVIMVPITVLSMVLAPYIVDLAVHDRFGQMDLSITLFRIMIPIVVLMSLAGVVIGILNAFGHFSTPALAPVAWNLVVIVMLLVGGQLVDADHQIHMYAVGVLVGTVIQLLLPLPWLRGRGGVLAPTWDIKDPAVKEILRMMLPVTASLALVNLGVIVGTYFSTSIPASFYDTITPAGTHAVDSGPALLDKAFRVFQLPQGIFALAVSTVFLPLLSRHKANEDREAFGKACAAAIRQLIVLLMPAATFMYFLAEPIIKLLYQRGAWEPWQTPLSAGALAGFSGGLVANGAMLLLMRAFFSLRMPWLPVKIGVANLGVNIITAWALHEKYGVAGVALAMAIANSFAFVAMYVSLRSTIGGLYSRQLVLTVIPSFAGACAAALLGKLLYGIVTESTPLAGVFGTLAGVTAAFVTTFGLYLVIAVKTRLISTSTLTSLVPRGQKRA